jgi:hypothetical protein
MNDVRHGFRDQYAWFWSRHGHLGDFAGRIPEIVLGRVVAVTLCDSGGLVLSPDELVAGWTSDGIVAFSPIVTDPKILPTCGWDEWYVLDVRRELPELDVFVNYGGLTPSSAPLGPLDPTWDRGAAEERVRFETERAEQFWCQLLSIRPIAFLAEGDALTCVTCDDRLLDEVLAAMRRAPS